MGLLNNTYFLPSHLELLDDAVVVSEDIISDHFGLTIGYWAKNPYEVKTLKEVGSVEIPGRAYAHLMKYGNLFDEKVSGADNRQLYRILVYDTRILEVTRGRRDVLWPFFIYIMAHELIHITRFSRFECAVDAEDKFREEKTVHSLTNSVLRPVPISGMVEVIDFFEGKDRDYLV
jgi:hypothetical protein